MKENRDRILDYLIIHDSPISSIDLAEELDIPINVVEEILRTLQKDGVIVRWHKNRIPIEEKKKRNDIFDKNGMLKDGDKYGKKGARRTKN